MTTSVSTANHSYSTHGDYILNLTAFNDISSVIRTTNVTVCKPVIPIVTLAVTTSPTNISDPVEFTMTLREGSDFECSFNFGDGSFEFYAKECYNLTYFADGANTDKTPFMNLEFKVTHNYSSVGSYAVHVYCSNRLSDANFTLNAIVQKPIEGLVMAEVTPKIRGHNFPIAWTMANGTNVTFKMEIQGAGVSHSSFKTDIGDSPTVNVDSSAGVFLVTLQATNLVSEANLSITVIVQDDVTQVSFKTWTTTSDFGSNIPGSGVDNNIFACEYPVNFTATPDKGTNLTFWWKFGDGDERNTTDSTITHPYAEGENVYWTNVTVFNLVSSVTKMFRLQTERSFMNPTMEDNSPVKINRTTSLQLSFTKHGTKTCIAMDMGDGLGRFVFGQSHCDVKFPQYQHVFKSDESITSISHQYTYKTIDEFWVQVNASNTVSRKTLSFKSVTAALSCFYPNATILGE